MKKELRRGFTLIEMLVVFGIIAVLVGASIGGYSHMTKVAEKAKAQELVSNVATALTQLFLDEGVWPQALALNGATEGRLNAEAALPLAKYFSLTTDTGDPATAMSLKGHDRFGIVTPAAMNVIKRKGNDAMIGDLVTSNASIEDHILYYALDLDGDGIIKGAKVGGESVNVRATAIVWSVGKSGGKDHKPWPYTTGLNKDDVYSWTPAQTKNVD